MHDRAASFMAGECNEIKENVADDVTGYGVLASFDGLALVWPWFGPCLYVTIRILCLQSVLLSSYSLAFALLNLLADTAHLRFVSNKFFPTLPPLLTRRFLRSAYSFTVARSVIHAHMNIIMRINACIRARAYLQPWHIAPTRRVI